MKITAIIAEYNPFHNGHKYQIDTVRKSCDAVVVIMSGSFVQRGEPAVFDKWTRAELALQNGANLVIELPVCYSVNTAERFAYGSVAVLDALSVVDELCFGSECGNIDLLTNAAAVLLNEPPSVSEKIKSLLNSGISYPSAREKAFSEYISPDLLNKPNNILAVEYIRTLFSLNSRIKPVTLKRKNVEHNDMRTNGIFASATAVREMMMSGTDISAYVPFTKRFDIYDFKRLDTVITSMLRTISVESLAKINDVSEGLENRIIAAAEHYFTINDICNAVKTKRYTMTKIKRILISALLGLNKNICKSAPQYIRVLGTDSVGFQILSKAKKVSKLPIVTKLADFDLANEMLKKDILATDIAALCSDNSDTRIAKKDFYNSPIIFK